MIIHLYKSLVLPILHYASSVWSPYIGYEVKRLEQVHHKFLRYLAFKSGRPMHQHNQHSGVMSKFKLPSLVSIRKVKDFIMA